MKKLLLLPLLFCSVMQAQIFDIDIPYVPASKGTATKSLFKGVITMDFQNCGTGVKDSTGKWVIPPIYTNLYEIYHTCYYRALLGDYMGVIDTAGRTIVPFNFDQISTTSVDDSLFFSTRKDKLYGLYSLDGKELIPTKYAEIKLYSPSVYGLFDTNRNFFFRDSDGKLYRVKGRLSDSPRSIDDSIFAFKKKAYFFRIRYHRYGYRSRRQGLIDLHGNVILKPHYYSISSSKGGQNLVRVNGKKGIYYFTREGKPVLHFQSDIGTVYFRNKGSELPMNSIGRTVARINGKWGVISVNGDTIVPFIYDHQYSVGSKGRSSLVQLEVDNHTGIYDLTANRWILDPVYEGMDPMNTYLDPSDSSEVVVFKAYKNGLYGIMTSRGQEILPFAYKMTDHSDCSEFFLSDAGSVIVSTPHGKRNKTSMNYYSSSSTLSVDVTNSGGLFERRVMPDGSVFFVSNTVLADTFLMNTGNYNLPESYKLNPLAQSTPLPATAIIISPVKTLVPVNDTLFITRTTSTDLIKSKTSADTIYYLMSTKRIGYKNSFKFDWVSDVSGYTYYGTRSYYSDHRIPLVIRSDGKIIVNNRYYSSFAHEEDVADHDVVFKVYSRKGKAGILDENGKILIDTVWNSIGEISWDYATVTTPAKLKRNTYHNKQRENNILDISTGQLMIPTGLTPIGINYTHAHAATTSTRKGDQLYSYARRDYVTPGGITRLKTLDAYHGYYAIHFQSGMIGILDANGTYLTDTIYTALCSGKYNFNGFRDSASKENGVYYFLRNGKGQHLIFNSLTGTIENEAQCLDRALSLAARNTGISKDYRFTVMISYSPALYIRDSTNTDMMPAWQKHVLFDSLFFPQRCLLDSNASNRQSYYYWVKRKRVRVRTYEMYQWNPDYDTKSHVHIVTYHTDSAMSVARTKYFGTVAMNYLPAIDLFFNTIMMPDGPHAVVLDSLFTGTEWKLFLINYVQKYLTDHPGIDGACMNPGVWPILLKDQFQFSDEGLVLYPPHFTYKSHALTITIPWSELKPYLRAEVSRKFIH